MLFFTKVQPDKTNAWKLRFALFPTRVGVTDDNKIVWTWLSLYYARDVPGTWDIVIERRLRTSVPRTMPYRIVIDPR